MVKLLRFAGWNGVAAELNFLIFMNKNVLVGFLSVSLYAAVLAVKGLLCNNLGTPKDAV